MRGAEDRRNQNRCAAQVTRTLKVHSSTQKAMTSSSLAASGFLTRPAFSGGISCGLWFRRRMAGVSG